MRDAGVNIYFQKREIAKLIVLKKVCVLLTILCVENFQNYFGDANIQKRKQHQPPSQYIECWQDFWSTIIYDVCKHTHAYAQYFWE